MLKCLGIKHTNVCHFKTQQKMVGWMDMLISHI